MDDIRVSEIKLRTANQSQGPRFISHLLMLPRAVKKALKIPIFEAFHLHGKIPCKYK